MSRSFIGAPSSGSVPAQQRRGEPQVFVLHRLELRRRLHLEQRRLLQAAAADHVEVGEMRQRLQADARR